MQITKERVTKKPADQPFSMPESIEGLARLPDEGCDLLTHMQEYVTRIDILLKAADTRLDALQPVRSGRLRIAWWKGNGETGIHIKRPYLVEWTYQHAGDKWTAEIVTDRFPQKVKRAGLYRENAERVRGVVMVVADLLAARERAADLLARFRKGLTLMLAKNEGFLSRAERQIQDDMDADAM